MIERGGTGWHAEDRPGLDERRDEHGRDTYAKAREVKAVLADARIRRRRARRWRHVVKTSAVFVIGDEEQGCVPRWSVADGPIDVMDQRFTERDVIVRVLTVPARLPRRLEEAERRQLSGGRRRLEVRELPKMRLVGGGDVGEGMTRERRAVVAVNRPAEAVPGEQTEDAGAVKTRVLSSMWP